MKTPTFHVQCFTVRATDTEPESGLRNSQSQNTKVLLLHCSALVSQCYQMTTLTSVWSITIWTTLTTLYTLTDLARAPHRVCTDRKASE
ncbi:hypothetical protein BaRGS_00019728 [Batillaria attramentaria]|uniref:Uncharacterized protein n=1 Tax=Batillaria attramentaria TaxID=370345 RepID=A0ABD0KPJ6_9CAEN